MTTSAELLSDAFGRVREVAHQAVDGLTEEQLAVRPGGGGNSIAWLVWHLSRVADDHLADAAGTGQVWTGEQDWYGRFGLPFDADATGYGHSADEVAAVLAGAELLGGYLDAVFERAVRYVGELTDAALDRVVDPGWDPPVTLAVRLVSVVSDGLQHAGQAGYLRGLLPG